MTPLIDVGAVLRGSVTDRYSNLVTRHTGRAVRSGIERELETFRDGRVAIIDFSHVSLLDYSCADEIIAQLLIRFAGGNTDAPAPEAYFVFRGVGDHLDPIEHVLEHHGLAIVMETPGGDTLLLGEVSEAERLAWQVLKRVGPAAVVDIAHEAGLPSDACERALVGLWNRRLVVREASHFVAVGAVQ